MKRKPLTTLEAANIGREMGVRGLCIYRDDIDRDLWRVVTPGRNEAHEPMDEKAWREFIAASGWIDRPARYDAGNGRKVTVPENTEVEDAGTEAVAIKAGQERRDPAEPSVALQDLLQDCMSPEAVAAVVAYRQPAKTKNDDVNTQIEWFVKQLTKAVGGDDEMTRLCEEVGL